MANNPSLRDRYHVILDGKGYVLTDESLVRGAQKAFNPRFSTGDPNLGDLSYWQFLAQETWDGGSGQKDFSTKNKIRYSRGWSLLSGKPKLCGGSSLPSGITAPTQLSATWAPFGSSNAAVPIPHQIFQFGSATAGQIALTLVGRNATGMDGTVTSLRASSTSLIGVRDIRASCAALWHRAVDPDTGTTTGTPGYLVVGRRLTTYSQSTAPSIQIFDWSWTSRETSLLQWGGATVSVLPEAIIAVDEQYLVIAGELIGTNIPQSGLITWNYSSGESFTETAQVSSMGSVMGTFSPHAALDGDGNVYFLCIGASGDVASEHFQSTIVFITAADAIATAGPVATQFLRFQDHLLVGLTSVNGTVYAVGARVELAGAKARFRAVVLKYPRTTVWEADETDDTLTDVLPRAIQAVSRSETWFVYGAKGSGRPQSIMRILPGDIVEEVTALPARSETGTDRIYTAVMPFGKSIYLYDVSSNRFEVADTDPSSTRLITSNLEMATSFFGGNTPLIEKALFKVFIQLSKALPAGQKLSVLAETPTKTTAIGSISASDGLLVTLLPSEEVVGPSFSIVVRATPNATWDGQIERITIQYVPTALKKKQWGFAIRCEKNLRLLNGQAEARSPAQIMQDVEAAWSAKKPVDFTDADGKEYKVVVTDFKARVPIVADAVKDQEAIIPVELLET